MPRTNSNASLEYNIKRARNNIAVKKSREKSKEKRKEILKKIQILKEQNKDLVKKMENMRNQINLYKKALETFPEGNLRVPYKKHMEKVVKKYEDIHYDDDSE